MRCPEQTHGVTRAAQLLCQVAGEKKVACAGFRFGAELSGSLEGRDRNVPGAAKPRPVGYCLELLSDCLVPPRCCCGAVPDGAVRLVDQCLGEGSVRAPKLVDGRRLLHRRRDQRVPESKSRVECPEAGRHGRCQVLGAQRPPCYPAELGQIDVVERCDEQQPPHVRVERRQSRRKCLLEAGGQRQRVEGRRGCSELGRRGRKLDQRKRVTGRFLEDPASERRRQPGCSDVQKRIRRALVQAGNLQLGEVAVVEAARHSLADGEQQDCRIRLDPPRDELEHLGGRPVQPVGVVDHEEQRRLGCSFCDQPQRRKADQEQVGSVALGNPERRLERAPLRVRKEIQAAEEREQQLVEPCEGELRLGEGTGRGHYR